MDAYPNEICMNRRLCVCVCIGTRTCISQRLCMSGSSITCLCVCVYIYMRDTTYVCRCRCLLMCTCMIARNKSCGCHHIGRFCYSKAPWCNVQYTWSCLPWHCMCTCAYEHVCVPDMPYIRVFLHLCVCVCLSIWILHCMLANPWIKARECMPWYDANQVHRPSYASDTITAENRATVSVWCKLKWLRYVCTKEHMPLLKRHFFEGKHVVGACTVIVFKTESNQSGHAITTPKCWDTERTVQYKWIMTRQIIT